MRQSGAGAADWTGLEGEGLAWKERDGPELQPQRRGARSRRQVQEPGGGAERGKSPRLSGVRE